MFTFHTRTATLATHATLPSAAEYAATLSTDPAMARGTVAVRMPQGGELPLSSFTQWSRGAMAACARAQARRDSL